MQRALAAFALLLAACAAPAGAPAPAPAIPTAARLEPLSATPTPEASPTPWDAPEGRPRYLLDVDIHYSAARLDVRQTLILTNPTGMGLRQLPLVVAARWVDAFELGELRVGGQPWTQYAFSQGVMTIALPEVLAPDAALHLELDYALRLPENPGVLSATRRQIHAANWYPYLPPYLPGRGWLIHPPGLVGEHLSFAPADFEVTLRPDDPGLVLMAPGARQDLDAGARFTLPGARAFAWSAGPAFLWLDAESAGIPVRAYIYPEHAQAGQAALETAAGALALYQELFGPYPHASLTLVEASFPDGLESDAFFFLDQAYFAEYDGTVRNYLTAIAAHETAHQWWYSRVGNDQALEPWLDEALCTFSELLFYERLHPSQVEWWWQFRVDRFNLEGYVDSAIYDLPEFVPYVKAVYLRGARFLNDVRKLTGERALLAALRDYAARHAGGIASAEDFFAILDEHSPADLANLRAYYFKP
ncbi:MAG: hypothetical protein HYZ26_03790 [Chloroflexi bacterium]|nr:hypothetical protein [Chloroflexota bacterium]